jgi:hypothetical protein
VTRKLPYYDGKNYGKQLRTKMMKMSVRDKAGTSTIYMFFVFLRVIQKNSVGT